MAVAVQHVVCRERNEMPRWQYELHARLHKLANIEIISVHKRRGGNPEHVLRFQLLGQRAFEEFLSK